MFNFQKHLNAVTLVSILTCALKNPIECLSASPHLFETKSPVKTVTCILWRLTLVDATQSNIWKLRAESWKTALLQ